VARATGLKVIKAVRVRDAASVHRLAGFKTDFHLVDAHVPGIMGGTGEQFDWRLVAEHPDDPPLILAGGLDPDNVVEAITTVRPFAVDVSSSLEREPGIKDHDQVGRFFAAVRGATTAAA
jgi:phosphoribosylanthranilate isomerase